MYFNYPKYLSDCFDQAIGPFFDAVYKIADFFGQDSNKYVCSRMVVGAPFGVMTSQIVGEFCKNGSGVKVVHINRGQVERAFIGDALVCKNKEKVPFWKVVLFVEKDWFSHPSGIVCTPIVLEPWEICSEDFVLMAVFHTEKEAQSFVKYLYTKLVRFLLFCSMDSSSPHPKTFEYVPFLNFSKEYSDEDLYKMFDFREGLKYFLEGFFVDFRRR